MVGKHYQERMDAPRMCSAKLAQVIGVRFKEVRIGEKKLTAAGVCYAAQETVIRYCQSADTLLGRQHVPWLKGIGEEHLHDQVVDLVLPFAQKMWADLQKPDRGRVKFKPDHYLKMWALTEPVIGQDFLLLDEAQDTNLVVEQVFTAQRGRAS